VGGVTRFLHPKICDCVFLHFQVPITSEWLYRNRWNFVHLFSLLLAFKISLQLWSRTTQWYVIDSARWVGKIYSKHFSCFWPALVHMSV